MDNPKVILTPNGDAIILSTICYVSQVYNSINNSNSMYDRCWFDIKYGPESCEYSFNYNYHRYADDKDALFNKVKNIHAILLKMINDGNDVKQINGGIQLKKDAEG